jgi:hypothetical protein
VTHETGDVRQVIERWDTAVRDYANGRGNVGTLMKYGADLVDALTSQPAPSGWQQRIAAMRQPLCPCCTTALVYHGWTNLQTHTRWQCPTCKRFVSIEPFDVAEGQNAVDALPPAPEVKDAPSC